MEKKRYKKGEILVHEGEPQSRMFIIANGTTIREKIIDDQVWICLIFISNENKK